MTLLPDEAEYEAHRQKTHEIPLWMLMAAAEGNEKCDEMIKTHMDGSFPLKARAQVQSIVECAKALAR